MRLAPLSAAVTAVAVGLLSASDGVVHTVARVSPEAAVLNRRIEGLKALLASAQRGPLTGFDETLIVIDERLVDDLLHASIPIRRTLQKKYSIVISQTSVNFREGFALVTLAGRASLADDENTFADIKVYGGLDIVELDRKSGILRGRMRIIAVDVGRVDLKGLTAPIEQLVGDLSRAKLSDFEDLLSSVDIPIRLQSEIEIPGVGPEGGVTIASLTMPLRASVERVRAFRGKLWISVAVSTAGTPKQAGAGGGAP